MQQRIKHLLQASAIWGAIVITIIITYLSLIKVNNLPKIEISNIDKLYHIIAYFSLTFSWLLVLKKARYKYKVLIGSLLYGIFIEVLQMTLTVNRKGELFDFLANSLGVLLALLIFNLFFKKKHLINTKTCK